MKVISPRQILMVVLVMFASLTRTADAQQGILDFLTTFDFDSFFASLCPVLESFDISVSFCGGGSDDDAAGDDATGDDANGDDGPAPVAAPTKKGKVVAGTAAPVAPSATP